MGLSDGFEKCYPFGAVTINIFVTEIRLLLKMAIMLAEASGAAKSLAFLAERFYFLAIVIRAGLCMLFFAC
jgi:hypothetical protein